MEAMDGELRAELQSFIKVQIEVVKMIREIILKVEDEDPEEPEIIPAIYIRNSTEI